MKIQISLSRDKQLLAGVEPVASAVVEIAAADIPEDLRPHIASMRTLDSGAIALEGIIRTAGCQTYITVSEPAAGTPETVLDWLREYAAVVDARRVKAAAERAEKEVEQMQAMEAYIAAPVADRIVRRQRLAGYGRGYREYWEARELTVPQSSPAELRDQYEASLAKARTEADRLTKAETEEEERAKAEAEEEERAKAARKHTQLTDAVARLGDESQQARWAEGMLPAREAVDLIIAEALAPVKASGLEVAGDVGAMTATGINHEDAYDGDNLCDTAEVETDETVLTKLSAETYVLLRKVRAAVPQGASVDAVKMVATCESCKARGNQTYIRASWTVGEIEVGINVVS